MPSKLVQWAAGEVDVCLLVVVFHAWKTGTVGSWRSCCLSVSCGVSCTVNCYGGQLV